MKDTTNEVKDLSINKTNVVNHQEEKIETSLNEYEANELHKIAAQSHSFWQALISAYLLGTNKK